MNANQDQYEKHQQQPLQHPEQLQHQQQQQYQQHQQPQQQLLLHQQHQQHPQHPQQHRPAQHGVSDEWETNLCNCSPCTSCLLGCFLPCMLLGRTMSRMRDPTMQSHSEINTDCGLFCCIQTFTCFGCVYNALKRGEIREHYGIKGSGCGDFCASYWCLCCSMIQQDNEVKLRSAQHGGPITQGYQPQKEGMHMPR